MLALIKVSEKIASNPELSKKLLSNNEMLFECALSNVGIYENKPLTIDDKEVKVEKIYVVNFNATFYNFIVCTVNGKFNFSYGCRNNKVNEETSKKHFKEFLNLVKNIESFETTFIENII
jgi:hypothetical protein